MGYVDLDGVGADGDIARLAHVARQTVFRRDT
jgi:hypothetical protein